ANLLGVVDELSGKPRPARRNARDPHSGSTSHAASETRLRAGRRSGGGAVVLEHLILHVAGHAVGAVGPGSVLHRLLVDGAPDVAVLRPVTALDRHVVRASEATDVDDHPTRRE